MSGQRRNNGSNTDGQDLVHLLSAEQRGEFIILVSTIAERMRRGIGEAFEAVEKREVPEKAEVAAASFGAVEKGGVQDLEVGEKKGGAGELIGFGDVGVGRGKRGLKSGEKEDGEMKEVLPEPMEYTSPRPPAGKKVAKMVSLSKNPLEEEDLPSGVAELSIIDTNPRGGSPISPPGEESGSNSEDGPLEVLYIAHHEGEDSDGELQLLAPEPMEYFPEAMTGETQRIQGQVDAGGAPLAGSPAVATPPVPGLTVAAAGKPLPPRKRPMAKRAITPKLYNLRRNALASHDDPLSLLSSCLLLNVHFFNT